MEKFGINPKNAYVFGDSSNDLAMFQFVEHAVAMGNMIRYWIHMQSL